MKKQVTFNEVLEQLGCDSSDSFYELMEEHWGNGLDAILTYDPKTEKAEIFSIYSNDWFNPYSRKVLLLRLNLPHKEKFDYLWNQLVYDADRTLQRIQKNEFRAF